MQYFTEVCVACVAYIDRKFSIIFIDGADDRSVTALSFLLVISLDFQQVSSMPCLLENRFAG